MTESKRAIHTDLAKLDAHEVQPEEFDDIPKLTDEFFDKAEIRRGDELIRRGRGLPPLKAPKKSRLAAPGLQRHRALSRNRPRLAIADQRRAARVSR
jgi:hypothetical protein